jgi:2'-5' RNA ligase
MEPAQSSLVVVMPEVEQAVGPVRAALGAAASGGVSLHVTVLYPFLPPARIDDGVLSAIGDVVAAVPRFDVTFKRLGWFGEAAVWLAPEPDLPFRRLTTALWRRFPETPPYGGAHLDSTPHLTIRHDVSRPLLERTAEAVSALLPIQAAVASVRLVSRSAGTRSWHTVTDFPLGEAV